MTMHRRYLRYTLIGLLLLSGCGGERGEPQSQASQSHATPGAQAAAARPASLDAALLPPPQRQPGEFTAMVPPQRPPRTLELVSHRVTTVPTIDGKADEPVWATAPTITTLDYSSQRPITLQSVHTAAEIFFLVTYPDSAPSETHKSWRWAAQEAIYKPLYDREDVFVFKWSMVGNAVNLALRKGMPHRADVWFWKARRTNPAGSADDKWHIASAEPHHKARTIGSPTHGTLYFRRIGDTGLSAYVEKHFYDYQGDVLAKYYPRQPQGSRGDIRAKGTWHNGQWTIEFARKLRMDHDDDVTFVPGTVYLFGVSCYEVTNDKVVPELTQPLYRTGDVFDRLLLRIAREGDV